MGRLFHTVIFDLDGTLSDSALLTMKALGVIAPRFGLEPPDIQAGKQAIGHANPEFYFRLFGDAPRDTVLQLGEATELEELRILPQVAGELLFPGCREMLEQLKAEGLSLSIASTGDSGHVEAVLRVTGIRGYFSEVACGMPDKTGMLRGLLAKSDKRGYMMVGDMEKDFEAARANGIISVGACYGYCVKEATRFDFYVETPAELVEYITREGR
jgi:phosphoglycolate phosphatase